MSSSTTSSSTSKTSKCAKSCAPSSTSSSSSLEVKEKEKKLGEEPKVCEGFAPQILYHKHKSAVVNVHAQFVLKTSGCKGLLRKQEPVVFYPPPSPPQGDLLGGAVPLPSIPENKNCCPLTQEKQYKTVTVINNGSGFFIKGHYIITAAHLVLMPPTLTGVVNRFPFVHPNVQDPDGNMKNEVTRASMILVDVYNVNNDNRSFTYEAQLVGVDGAGDIAILKIDPQAGFNCGNPCIREWHPYLKWGRSRQTVPGEKVYLLGDYTSHWLSQNIQSSSQAIISGILANNKFIDRQGWILSELVLVNANVSAFASGLPIIDSFGAIIGLQTTSYGNAISVYDTKTSSNIEDNDDPASASLAYRGYGFVSGPSEFFLRRVAKALVTADLTNQCDSCHIETITDCQGAYYRYLKGYLGIAYELEGGNNLNLTKNSNSINPNVLFDDDGNLTVGPKFKEILGIRVLALAGHKQDMFYIPGANKDCTLFPPLVDSPICDACGSIAPGDVITHFNGCGLGDLNCQIGPSVLTWALSPGDVVDLTYVKAVDAEIVGTGGYVVSSSQVRQLRVVLQSYPRFLDYPYYAVNVFPSLYSPLYKIDFPEKQVKIPQLPAQTNLPPYHPAV